MDELKKIIAIGLCGTVATLILKKNSPEISMAVSLITCTLIFFVIATSLAKVIYIIEDIFLRSGVDGRIAENVMKVCGIGILSEYFCSVISDAGETAVAKKLELSSKIIIFAYTLPIVIAVIENIRSVF